MDAAPYSGSGCREAGVRSAQAATTCGQVLGRGPAAPADHRDAQLADELPVELGQLVGGEVVVHGPVDHRGQAGVGEAGHRKGRVAGQVAQRLEHLARAGGAVEPDEVDTHGLEGAQGGTDLGAGQHGAGQLDGHLGLDGQVHAGGLHGPPGAVDGRLGLQEVEDRLDDDQVDAALDEGGGLLLVGVPQVGVPDLAEGGELGAGSDAAGHPPGPVRRGEVVGGPAGQRGRGQVELADPVALAVLGQDRGEGSEGVGLHHVAADLEERPVDPVDGVGPGDHQQLVAPLEVRAAEVVGGEVHQLEVGAHGAVEDDHPLGGGLRDRWRWGRWRRRPWPFKATGERHPGGRAGGAAEPAVASVAAVRIGCGRLPVGKGRRRMSFSIVPVTIPC